MSAIRVTPSPCVYCGYVLDACTPTPWEAPTAVPGKGDLTICFRCTGVLVFDGEPLTLRAPTHAEFIEAMANADTATFAMALRRFNSTLPSGGRGWRSWGGGRSR